MTVSQQQLDAIIAQLTDGIPPTVKHRNPTCRGTGCTERLDPALVDDKATNTGLHTLCDEPAITAAPSAQAITDAVAEADANADPNRYTTEPPSTVAYMRDVLTRYSASRPRSLQVALGPSELGTPCQRQIAYKLTQTARRPITDPEWAPLQGTAMHTLMEDVLKFENNHLNRARWVAEEHLTIDHEISGHGDAFDTDTNTVVDWKYVGTTALDKLRTAKRTGKPPADQVSTEYRIQAHLYGYGHERAGRTVEWVRLVLLARSWKYDDSDEWTERYDPEIAMRALHRYYATQDLLDELQPATNPTLWGAIPAAPSSDTCKWCVFQRMGGPADGTGCPGVTTSKIDKFTDGLIA